MRLSLALDARDFDLTLLKKLKVGLNQSNIDFKWVKPESLHIDVLPLGDLGREALNTKLELMKTVISKHQPFDVKLEGVWAYPEQKEARILWVGVQNTRELKTLRSELAQTLEIEEEETKPILPVVRFRNHRNVTDLISPFKNAEFPMITVTKILLVEMLSGGAYPTYKIHDAFSVAPISQ